MRTVTFASFTLVGPQESASSVREQAPPISSSGAKRRSTRIVHAVPLVVTWVDIHAKTVVEETATVSINCHGFRYFVKRRPRKNTSVTFQIIAKKEDKSAAPPGVSRACGADPK